MHTILAMIFQRVEQVRSKTKTMGLYFNMIDFVLNMMAFEVKLMNFVFKMINLYAWSRCSPWRTCGVVRAYGARDRL